MQPAATGTFISALPPKFQHKRVCADGNGPDGRPRFTVYEYFRAPTGQLAQFCSSHRISGPAVVAHLSRKITLPIHMAPEVADQLGSHLNQLLTIHPLQ